MLDRLLTALKARFGSAPALTEAPKGVDVLADMANRRVIRRYTERPVDPADSSCSGFQPSSTTFRIDCEDALPVEIL